MEIFINKRDYRYFRTYKRISNDLNGEFVTLYRTIEGDKLVRVVNEKLEVVDVVVKLQKSLKSKFMINNVEVE